MYRRYPTERIIPSNGAGEGADDFQPSTGPRLFHAHTIVRHRAQPAAIFFINHLHAYEAFGPIFECMFARIDDQFDHDQAEALGHAHRQLALMHKQLETRADRRQNGTQQRAAQTLEINSDSDVLSRRAC